jgi:uncharacterized membrane protein
MACRHGDLRMGKAEEDRILRVWTPLLLRTILIAALVVLTFGIILTYTYAPDYYVDRYYAVQQGHLYGSQDVHDFFKNVLAGEPHAVLLLGLFVLTLVPLARVAFCFLFFIQQRDYVYVACTAYVLMGLIIGMVIGGIG